MFREGLSKISEKSNCRTRTFRDGSFSFMGFLWGTLKSFTAGSAELEKN